MHPINIPQKIYDANLRRRGRVHALERIDPKRTALLVIDMQNAWLEPGFSRLEIPEARTIVPNINKIAKAIRAAGGIVAFTQHSWGEWPEFFEMFTQPGFKEAVIEKTRLGSHGHEIWPQIEVRPDDIRVVKNRPSAFIQGSSELEARLREKGIGTLIVSGTLTNACCESTARDAAALNFKVIFAGDATATRTDEEHNAALMNVMQFVADLWMTDELVAMIRESASS